MLKNFRDRRHSRDRLCEPMEQFYRLSKTSTKRAQILKEWIGSGLTAVQWLAVLARELDALGSIPATSKLF